MNDDLNYLLTKELSNTKEELWGLAQHSLGLSSQTDSDNHLLKATKGIIKKFVKKEHRSAANIHEFEAYESSSGVEILIAGALAAISLAEEDMDNNQPEEAMRRLCLANRELGIATRTACIDKEFDASETLSRLAKKAAQVKLGNDQKQAAKPEIKKLWDDWRAGKVIHKSCVAFARHAVKEWPIIESEETVKRWERDWRKESRKQALS